MTASGLRACAVALLATTFAALAAASTVAATNHGDNADSGGSTPSTEESTEQPEEQVSQDEGGIDACWDNIDSAPFNDIEGLSSEAVDAIDCMFHYRITRGTSAYSYSPDDSVIRSSMALFLIRTIETLGLTVPEDATESFADLADAPAEVRTAVAQLKALGVTTGYSSRVFGPDIVVERAHMAHFMARVLKLAGIDLPLPPSRSRTYKDVESLGKLARTHVSAMLELGIMEPVTMDSFDPGAAVTREDMALFLARLIDVSEIEPVRLELELSTETLMVGGSATATIRAFKPDGRPYAGLLIDVFADRGWRIGGACNLDDDARLNGVDAGTSENCTIDVSDPRTGSDGEVTVGLAHVAEVATNWIYAWAGTLGEEFDERKVRTEVKQRIDWQPVPTRVKLPEPFGVAFGEGFSIVVRLEGPNSAARRMALVSSYDGLMRVVRVETTNDEGEVAFSVPALANPDPGLFRPIPVDETILVFWDRNANGIHDGPAELSSETTIYWS